MRKITFLFAIILIATFSFKGSSQTTVTFDVTFAPQTFVVPPGVTEVDIVAFGAQGYSNQRGVQGGLGGQASGTLSVTPGQTLTIFVGAGGAGSSFSGGYNGGGNAGNSPCSLSIYSDIC